MNSMGGKNEVPSPTRPVRGEDKLRELRAKIEKTRHKLLTGNEGDSMITLISEALHDMNNLRTEVETHRKQLGLNP